MNSEDIKRGIDFENRFGQTASYIGHAFSWWEGKKLNRQSWLFIAIVFSINLIIVYPIFSKDVTNGYTTSAFLFSLSQLVKTVLHIPGREFFTFLTIVSLCLMPVSFYLFVRKIALRHEITALLATFLLILPNPFFYNTPIMVNAILNGDGAHVFVLSSFPLLLLYIQSFFAKGIPALGFLSALATAFIAIVSPFMAFNVLIFYFILMIGEGFQGKFRLKLLRFLFLLLVSAALCAFWYYPNVVKKNFIMSHVQSAISQFTSVLPLAIPAIPIAGALSFLLFDRREKLKPIFVGASLFIVYLVLYAVSNQLNIVGLFTAERYLPELVLSSSLFLSILFVLLSELLIRNSIGKARGARVYFMFISGISFVAILVCLLTIRGIGIVHEYISQEVITNYYASGIGNIKPTFDLRDITSILATLISLGTFIFLCYVVRKYPSIQKASHPKASHHASISQ